MGTEEGKVIPNGKFSSLSFRDTDIYESTPLLFGGLTTGGFGTRGGSL
jgi:hypothetical protein